MLTAATVLTALIGVGCLAGGISINSGKASEWPDVVASESTLKRVGAGLFIVSVLQWVSVLAVLLGSDYSKFLMLASTATFAVAGFAGNKVAFGDFRPIHTGTNTVIVGIIWGLIVLG